MGIFTAFEKKILKRFINQEYVETEEEDEVLSRYARVGFVGHHQYDWKLGKASCRLTKLGLKHLNREL